MAVIALVSIGFAVGALGPENGPNTARQISFIVTVLWLSIVAGVSAFLIGMLMVTVVGTYRALKGFSNKNQTAMQELNHNQSH